MQISIPPVVGQWIGVGILVAGGVAALSPSAFPSYIPAGAVRDIIQTAGFVAMFGGIVMGALGRYSSSAPGPGAPQDSPRVQAAMLEDQKDALAKKAAALSAPK